MQITNCSDDHQGLDGDGADDGHNNGNNDDFLRTENTKQYGLKIHDLKFKGTQSYSYL